MPGSEGVHNKRPDGHHGAEPRARSAPAASLSTPAAGGGQGRAGDASLAKSAVVSHRSLRVKFLLVFRRFQLRSRSYVAQALASIRRNLALTSAPRPGDKTLSARWLTRLLKSHGLLPDGVRVISADPLDVQGNRGLSGAMVRLKIVYSGQAPHAPKMLILKMSRDGVSARRGTIASGQAREATFYNSPYAAFVASQLPDVFYSYASDLFGEFVILMEDLSLRDATICASVFGGQSFGADGTPYDAVQTLRDMYIACAKLHARTWRDPTLFRSSWLKAVPWYRGTGRSAWEASIDAGRMSWEAAKARVQSGALALDLSPRLVEIMDKSYAKTSWEAMQAHLRSADTPWALSHGDFHANNMFVVEDVVGKVMLVDWSEVGVWEPTADLAQTMISDVKPEIFRPHAKNLVRVYWNELVANGVDPEVYTFGMCWESFARAGAERWIWLFSVLAAFPGVPSALVQWFHDQLLAFLDAFCDDSEGFQLKAVVVFAQ